jgi:polysaccharide pyruvyl transferase WcaK-like protein
MGFEHCMEQLRFTVAGYYGFGNLGDEAILSSMIADFRRVFPRAVFEIVCADYSPTISGPDITTVPWKDWPRAIESVRGCDWLIVGGGGIFTYHLNYSKEDFLRQSESFAAFIFGLPVLAHLLGKRSFLYGIGASRMESAAALEHARAAARLADACTVRDARSREILGASVEDRLRIQEYADPAFRLENEPLPAAALAEAGIRSDEPIVAIVARNWETSDTKALWEGLTTEVLRDFAMRHSIRLLFIPFHAASDIGNDLNNDPAVICRMRNWRTDCAPGRSRQCWHTVK